MRNYKLLFIGIIIVLALISVNQNYFQLTNNESHSNTSSGQENFQIPAQSSQNIHISCLQTPCTDPTSIYSGYIVGNL